ncbi:hypothetical protein BpHYR1_003415 [Brachionus plicatilis]|uniref:Transposase n=1 Tax=Brachionus plicatilis TaxID=10195 RepID=A0A3M7RCF6_BRAPC|nr:hypothetical protein BpHYR1_003415 [Brachionus plicatilis]
MQDAWDASYNAIRIKRYLVYSDEVKAEIRRQMRNLHMSLNQKYFDANLKQLKLYSESNCPDFYKYLEDVWLKTHFKHWQIIKRPAGYSCTNSPLESFNSSIKRTFTLSKKLSIFNFVRVMLKIAKYYSIKQDDFEINPHIF